MARRPSSPKPRETLREVIVDATRPPAPQRRRVDVGEWAGGIRLSAFSVVMLSLVVLGAWVLVPTFGTYLEQRQKIAALEESVQVTTEQLAELERERERWRDPAYITTQARERLYYVRPGEIIYLIDNDLEATDLPADLAPVSDQLEVREADWMPQLLRSLTSAGLARTAVATH